MKRIIAMAALVGATLVGTATGQTAASREISDAIPLSGEGQLKGFRVPNFDSKNVMISQIFGEAARVLPDGNVEIEGLKLEFYSYEGLDRKTDMTVTSPLCFYNRSRGVVVSDSDVRISRDEMVVTGKGFRYSNDKQELKILSESKVVLKGATREKGLKEKKRE